MLSSVEQNSKTLIIRRLTSAYESLFFTAIHKWTELDFVFAPEYQPSMKFSDYLAILADREAGRNLPQDRVPDTVLYGFLGDEIFGRISIRHKLNEFLLNIGSVRTIEACGGILENTVDADGGKLRKRRYWINIE